MEIFTAYVFRLEYLQVYQPVISKLSAAHANQKKRVYGNDDRHEEFRADHSHVDEVQPAKHVNEIYGFAEKDILIHATRNNLGPIPFFPFIGANCTVSHMGYDAARAAFYEIELV